MQVSARALLAGNRLGEEAGAEAERLRDTLGGKLDERRVVGRAQTLPRGQVQLKEARAGLSVDRSELDSQGVEGGRQGRDKLVIPPRLDDAVADPGRQRPATGVPDPHLVLEGGPRLVAELADALEGASEHLPCRELARRAVPPRGRREADAPPWPPGELVQRLGIGSHDEIARARTDPELFVVRDRRVDRIEREEEVRHDRPVFGSCLEGIRAQRLAAQVAVHVRHGQEDVLRVRHARTLLIRLSTSPSVAASRSIISASSVSVAT